MTGQDGRRLRLRAGAVPRRRPAQGRRWRSGIDLSHAVDAARKNFGDDPDVLIVQGDLLRPPFREGAFDGGLHRRRAPPHAGARRRASPRWRAACGPAGGCRAASTRKAGSTTSVRPTASAGCTQALAGTFGYVPALVYSYFAAYVICAGVPVPEARRPAAVVEHVERNWLVSLWLKDAHWRVLDTFDAITPQIATTHTEAEVAEWMAAAGCEWVQRTGVVRDVAVADASRRLILSLIAVAAEESTYGHEAAAACRRGDTGRRRRPHAGRASADGLPVGRTTSDRAQRNRRCGSSSSQVNRNAAPCPPCLRGERIDANFLRRRRRVRITGGCPSRGSGTPTCTCPLPTSGHELVTFDYDYGPHNNHLDPRVASHAAS